MRKAIRTQCEHGPASPGRARRRRRARRRTAQRRLTDVAHFLDRVESHCADPSETATACTRHTSGRQHAGRGRGGRCTGAHHDGAGGGGMAAGCGCGRIGRDARCLLGVLLLRTRHGSRCGCDAKHGDGQCVRTARWVSRVDQTASGGVRTDGRTNGRKGRERADK